MTNTPTEEREDAATDDAATPVPASSAAPAVAPAEPTPFWQRRYVEKFLVPLLLPIAVIVGIVAYILNISRIFLSAHGHIPIFVGTFILLFILVGATLLSAAPNMRQSSLTLASVLFILLIMASGWLVLGSAQPKESGPVTLPATLKTNQSIPVVAAPGGALKFAPNELKAKTGLATMKVTVAAPGHTFTMQDPATLFESLSLNAGGTVESGVAYFGKAGTYTFFCAIPGHEAAGMKGTITVTGPDVTLAEALKASGNPASAAG
jgi:plastocyanin